MRSAPRSIGLAVLGCLALGCDGKKPNGASIAPSASALPSPSGSSAPAPIVPSASAGSPIVANARIVPAGAPLGPLEVLRSERAGLALLLAEDGAHATIVNEKTGEWRFVRPRRDGETTVLETAGAKLSIAGPPAKRRLSLSFGEGAARGFDAAIVKLPSSSPTAAYTVDGEALSSAALGASPRVMLGKTSMIWQDGFLPASPSLPPPTRLALGARAIAPAPLALRRDGRCTVVGFTPKTEGPLAEALATAQTSELAKLCGGRTEPTLIEASYGFIRFKGVNLEQGFEPDPTDVVGLDLLFRVTDSLGSTLAETGYLVGLAKGEVSSLASLLKPTGAAFLEKKALDPYYVGPPQLGALSPRDRSAALDLSRATLALGPSTIDIVIPAEPHGLFLGARRVRLGPRSDLFPAFVNGPLTQRLVAAVMVDY